MRATDTSRYYRDDPDWSRLLCRHARTDVEDLENRLAEDLAPESVRVFHGCRTGDAGTYHREGLRAHVRGELVARFRRLVAEDARLGHLAPRVDALVDGIGSDHEEGRCHVVLDSRPLLEHAAHYLIYGSELVCAFLPFPEREVLLDVGTPTLIHLDLPLSRASPSERLDLAKVMLREWTRLVASGDGEVVDEDFTFTLRGSAPASWVVGHSHPMGLRDPYLRVVRRSPRSTCAHCEGKASTDRAASGDGRDRHAADDGGG